MPKIKRKLIYCFYFFCAVIAIMIAILIPLVNKTRNDAIDMRCQGKLYELQTNMKHYLEGYAAYRQNNRFPSYVDENGNEKWSWRVFFILMHEPEFQPDKTFISENDKANYIKKYSYPSLLCSHTPESDISPFVAIKGPGTLWSSIDNGIPIPDSIQSKMIIMLETPFPTKKWYEPGDDLSPNDVIKLYENYKSSKLKLIHGSIYYATFAGTGSFDDIKNAEELKERLIYDNKQAALLETPFMERTDKVK